MLIQKFTSLQEFAASSHPWTEAKFRKYFCLKERNISIMESCQKYQLVVPRSWFIWPCPKGLDPNFFLKKSRGKSSDYIWSSLYLFLAHFLRICLKVMITSLEAKVKDMKIMMITMIIIIIIMVKKKDDDNGDGYSHLECLTD